ncbi:hypothetical protein GCM10009665_26110 [Kitasatospora nipponensis]|uniref:Uncharacterized protein n=1 Tax=Kitasatospora nipponensis TaxID=258049 RepID=A0ABN1W473_9ACTN
MTTTGTTTDPGAFAARLRGRELPARLLGGALLVSALDPAALRGSSAVRLVPALVVLALAWWAAPPVTARHLRTSARLHRQLARHRNTVLATTAVVLAALTHPGPWSAAMTCALLLGYLLHVDTRTHAHLPVGPGAVLASCAAAALVLAAALAPTGDSDLARLLATLGVTVTALAVGLTLWERR